jgi:hypothetical protein
LSFECLRNGNLISLRCCHLPLHFSSYRLCYHVTATNTEHTGHSTVDMATVGSRNRGSVSGWGKIHSFPPNVHTDSWYDTTSYKMSNLELFPLGYSCQSVKLNTHLQLMTTRKLSGTITQLPNAPSWRVR